MSFEVNVEKELLGERRLRWACRRGLLELDLLLGGFIDKGYQDLSDKEKFIFQDLLLESDQQLFEYFIKKAPPGDAEIARVIKKICLAATA